METKLLLLLGFCFGGARADPGTDLLYPHTVNNGDTKVAPEHLDWYNEVPITDVYRFYDVDHTTLYVSTKGVVTFDWGWTWYIPEPLSYVNTPMISPLWSDNNLATPDQGENILYRETQDPELLARFSDDISGYFTGSGGPGFNPTSLMIATWQRVGNWCWDVGYDCWWYWWWYRDGGELPEHVYPLPGGRGAERDNHPINGFQLVLATDGSMTFAMFNMHTIEWTCCGDWHRSGFTDGLYDRSYELPDSGTENVADLTLGTNVNKGGRWVFRVDECNVLDPQCIWKED